MKDLFHIVDGTKRSLSQKPSHFVRVVPTMNHLRSDKNTSRTSYINKLSWMMNLTGLNQWKSKEDEVSTRSKSSSQAGVLLNHLNSYPNSSGIDTRSGTGIMRSGQEINVTHAVKANLTTVDSTSKFNLGKQTQDNSLPSKIEPAADKHFEMKLQKPEQGTSQFANRTYNGSNVQSIVRPLKHSSKPSKVKGAKVHRSHQLRNIKRNKKKSKHWIQKYRNKKLLGGGKALKRKIKLFVKDLESLLQSSSDQNLIRSFTNEMEHSVRNIAKKNKQTKKHKLRDKNQIGIVARKAPVNVDRDSIFNIARRYHVDNRTLMSYVRAQNVLRSGWPYLTGMRRNLTLHSLLDAIRNRVQTPPHIAGNRPNLTLHNLLETLKNRVQIMAHNNSLLSSKQNNTARNASSLEVRTNASFAKEKLEDLDPTSVKDDTKLSGKLSSTQLLPSYVLDSIQVTQTPALVSPSKTYQSLSTLHSSPAVTSQIVSMQSSTYALLLRKDTLLPHETNFSKIAVIKPTQVQPSLSLLKAASQLMTDRDASSGDRLISDLLDAYQIVLKEKVVRAYSSDRSAKLTRTSSVQNLSRTKVVSVMPSTTAAFLITSSPSSQVLFPSSSHTQIFVPTKTHNTSDPRDLSITESMPPVLNEEEVSKNRLSPQEGHSTESNNSHSTRDKLLVNATEEDKELYLLQNLKDLFTGKLNVSVPILQPEISPILEDKAYSNNHTPTPPLSEDDPNLDIVNEMDLITALVENDAAAEKQENSTDKGTIFYNICHLQ